MAIILAVSAVISIAEKIIYTEESPYPIDTLFINNNPDNNASGNKRPKFNP